MCSKNTLPTQDIVDVLAHGEMTECRLTPEGSNYTFFAVISDGAGHGCPVIYKPREGEAPLGDFPEGTLYKREYAAYLLSEALGWGMVPYTIIRQGTFGIGSVQVWIDFDPRAHYFNLRETHPEKMLQICAFDVISNNADRKASHCLLDTQGKVWAIDHGITFHPGPKLRTVIWDYAGDPVPKWVLRDVERLAGSLDAPGGLGEQLASLFSDREIAALRGRVRAMLDLPVFPFPGPRRAVPWPWF